MLYFIEVLGFCIMGNHFHILIRMIPDHHFTDEAITSRYVRFYGEDVLVNESLLSNYRNKRRSDFQTKQLVSSQDLGYLKRYKAP